MPRPSRSAISEEDLFLHGVPLLNAGATRVFLGWEKPLVQSVAEYLAAGWDGTGALDLSDWMIVVPTKHASRRLREALALLASTRDAAVLPPLTVTPDFLSSPERRRDLQAAGQVETLLLWTAGMLKLDLEDYRHLFPVDPVERTFSWALKTAGDLLQVRETLNENGLSLEDAARMLEKSEMEPERWRDLGRLEKQCIAATEDLGFTDWQVARREAAAKGDLPETVRRIMIAGVLDPSALAIQALDRYSRSLPVQVLIFAPQTSHSGYFDPWGRPLAELWLTEPIHIEKPETRIHQGGTPAAQAAQAMELLSSHSKPGEIAAIGVADVEISAPLEKTLAEHDIGAYDPAGRRMGTHGVFHLLRLLSQLAASRSFSAASQLMRCPDIAKTIRVMAEKQTRIDPSLTRLLNDLDELASEALPDTLDDAIELAPRHFDETSLSPVIVGLSWLDNTLKNLSGSSFGSALTDFLADVFSSRPFRLDRPQDAVFAAIADQISQVLDALEGPAAEPFQAKLNASSRLELLLRVMEDQVFYPERTARDIDLQGWLELLWEDAQHLIVTGMNDGKVPESILSHQFLPDSARRALGLRNNDTRFARDACLMTSMIELRKRSGGRVDFIFGRIGSAEEPMRPSRLLFQCPDADLAERTLQFFKKPVTHSEPMPWQLAWRLKPRPLADDAGIFSKLSVTQFRDYLTCPFRFYLKHGLKTNSVDAAGTEMDAMAFGSLMHHVLEKFATESPAKTSTDPAVIRAEFHRLLEARLHATFGQRLTVPVMIQCESARQRLSWWAEVEAEERAKGWQIVAAETRLSPEGDPWKMGDMIISGIVDRVERHQQLGIRLIDFKTYSPSTALKGERKSVEDYHLRKIKRSEDASLLPPWVLTISSKGEEVRWADLQLPLYHLAMQRRYPNEKIHTAYATLGKTRGDIGIDAWPDLEGSQLEHARACAQGIISAIMARQFWPPTEKLPFGDDFGHLFFGDPLKAVDASFIINQEAA
ncbi:MAG: PD-(D/E)XK nuclease family protein [Verrucomicrobia bacterium]|nr:PD-(D/E)XK nuclease family protein [Verrucomicrobiota bacterium]